VSGPADQRTPDPGTAAAVVTASYARDFERCRVLCESIDRRLSGYSRHYLLVEHADVPLFRQLQNSRRIVISERDILPAWLRPFPDPVSGFRRRIWLSRRTKPLRGWHVQQLRRIAIAAHVEEPALVYCDSDVVIVRDFDCAALWKGNKLRLFRRERALLQPQLGEQRQWSRNAGRVLGLDHADAASQHDYITTFIAWRRDAVLRMCRRIENVNGVHWVEAVGSRRQFSECMIYGRHADEILGGKGHYPASDELCRVYWRGPDLTDDALRGFIASMTPDQVAVGLQSFIGTDVERIRRLVLDGARQAHSSRP
jgi:hypothetical protein